MPDKHRRPSQQENEKTKKRCYSALRKEYTKILGTREQAERFLNAMNVPERLDEFRYQPIESSVKDITREALSRLAGSDPKDSANEQWSWDSSLWEFVDTVLWSFVAFQLHQDGRTDIYDIVSNSEKLRQQAEEYGMTDGVVIREMLRLGNKALMHLDSDDMRKKAYFLDCDDDGKIQVLFRYEE